MIARILAVFVFASFAAAQRPVTHEDLWLMRRVGTPVISPDGTRAVFSVTMPSYDSSEQRSDLWVVATDGSAPPRQLTGTRGSEGGVTWSPDGSRIAFTAKRGDDSKRQVYVLGMNGPGEARRITSLSAGARRPAWSPSGDMLAFESDVWRGAANEVENAKIGEERAKREVKASAYEQFPVRYWDRWLDERQVHLFVVAAHGEATPRNLLAGTQLVAGPGYSGSPASSGDGLQAAWTPDGRSLVFVATERRHESAHSRVFYHLYRVSTKNGEEPRRLTSDDASYSSPKFGHGGRHLFCQRVPSSEFVYNLPRLVRLGWPTLGQPQAIDPAFDRPMASYDLASDGRTVLLLATDTARRRLFAVPAAGGTTRPLDQNQRGVYAGPDEGGGVIVARWEDSIHPAEIVRVDPRTGRRTALTSFNVERTKAIDWQSYREFWFESSRGRRIHNWVVVPPGFDPSKEYPLVVFIHGGPHSSSMDAGHIRWSAQLMAAPGYVVLLPDYTGSVGYGEQFSRNIQGDPLKTPGDELVESVDALAAAFDWVDSDRVAAAGASYGGHLANWLEATTTRFRCLIGHAGLVSLEGQWATSDVIYHRELNNGGPPWGDSKVWREQSPSTYAGAFKTPMMLTVGERDYRVPLNQTLAAWSYLKRQKVPSRLLVFHDSNHWIMRGPDARYYWEQVHAWLARWLRD